MSAQKYATKLSKIVTAKKLPRDYPLADFLAIVSSLGFNYRRTTHAIRITHEKLEYVLDINALHSKRVSNSIHSYGLRQFVTALKITHPDLFQEEGK
jgi:hypothetical protein